MSEALLVYVQVCRLTVRLTVTVKVEVVALKVWFRE